MFRNGTVTHQMGSGAGLEERGGGKAGTSGRRQDLKRTRQRSVFREDRLLDVGKERRQGEKSDSGLLPSQREC